MYTTLIKNQEEEGLGSAGKELAESSLAVLYEQNEVRRHVRPEHKGAGEGKRLFPDREDQRHPRGAYGISTWSIGRPRDVHGDGPWNTAARHVIW